MSGQQRENREERSLTVQESVSVCSKDAAGGERTCGTRRDLDSGFTGLVTHTHTVRVSRRQRPGDASGFEGSSEIVLSLTDHPLLSSLSSKPSLWSLLALDLLILHSRISSHWKRGIERKQDAQQTHTLLRGRIEGQNPLSFFCQNPLLE